jgi:hypothetical protein
LSELLYVLFLLPGIHFFVVLGEKEGYINCGDLLIG